MTDLTDLTDSAGSEKSYGTLGRDVGVVGRWFRLLAGGGLAGYVAIQAAGNFSISEIIELALYFIVTLGLYTAAHYVLGKRWLSIKNAWLRTAILLGPLGAIFAFQLGPHVLHQAILLYLGVSLVFSFFMRYGGCEVMSIPGLLLGARDTVYCPLNAVDAVEKAVIDRRARNQAAARITNQSDGVDRVR